MSNPTAEQIFAEFLKLKEENERFRELLKYADENLCPRYGKTVIYQEKKKGSTDCKPCCYVWSTTVGIEGFDRWESELRQIINE
jgi:hypothetical protein